MSSEIRSLQLERRSLGGLIRHPKVYYDVCHFISEEDYSGGHKRLWSVISNLVNNNQPVDTVIIAEKIKNLGISIEGKSERDIYTYVEDISFKPIDEVTLIETFRELKAVTVLRKADETCDKIKAYIRGDGRKDPIDKAVATMDSDWNEHLALYDTDCEPVDLFEGAEDLVESKMANPTENIGIPTPYKSFNDLWGPWRNGHVYIFGALYGQGKSTILNDITKFTAGELNIPVLFCDTEMFREEVLLRDISGETNIPTYYLETGKAAQNKNYSDIWRSKKKEFAKYKGKIDYLEVPDKSIDQLESIITRWYFSKIKRGQPALVVIDYLKVTTENDNKPEWQIISDKLLRIKTLAAKLQIPIISATQLNRSAEDGVEHGGAISQSHRLSWVTAFMSILKRKTLEELASEGGPEYGSHKLIPIKTRFQGKNAQGHNSYVRVKEKGPQGKEIIKYKQNFIHLDIQNFKVIDKGTFEESMRAMENTPIDLKKPTQDDPPF